MFSGPLGDASVKRGLGALCVLSLIIGMFVSGKKDIHFDINLISSVTYIAIACVTGTVVEKFSPQIKNMSCSKTDLEVSQ